MKNVIQVESPIVKNALSHLRDKNLSREDFRKYSHISSLHLVSSAVFDLDLRDKTIDTPISQTEGKVLSGNVVLLPVLRSGIALLPAALEIIAGAKVGVAGFRRNEETAVAYEYYWNIPEVKDDDTILILDPMIATGGTMIKTLEKLEKHIHRVRIVSIVSAPEGISNIHKNFPDVVVITASVDERLNGKKYIVPGLGDFGDRFFGTET